MKINKDEAVVLAAAINGWKTKIIDEFRTDGLPAAFTALEKKLQKFGNDKKREEDFFDLLKRFSSGKK
jgi:hypothetical protein